MYATGFIYNARQLELVGILMLEIANKLHALMRVYIFGRLINELSNWLSIRTGNLKEKICFKLRQSKSQFICNVCCGW